MRAIFLVALAACQSRDLAKSQGLRVRAEAVALRPHKTARWLPLPGERVVSRAHIHDWWHLSPPGAPLPGAPLIDDVYPFLAARDRPPAEVNAYVACAVPGTEQMLFAQVRSREASVIHAFGEDGAMHDALDADCIPLEGRFADPDVTLRDTAAHILALDPDMPPAAQSELQREPIDLPTDAKGDVGLWPTVLHDGETTYVAYCDGYRGDVKLAHRREGAWIVDTVDARGAVGKYLTAVMGPGGPELAYLDQGRKVLRYARRVGEAWQLTDVLEGRGEVGIAARLLLGPHGERDIVHYSSSAEFLITQGVPHHDGLRWSTRLLDHAMGTYQSTIGAVFDAAGVLHLSYPEQNIGDPALRLTTVPVPGHEAAEPDEVHGVFATAGAHAAAQTEMIDSPDGPELYYLSSDDQLNVAQVTKSGRGAALTVGRHVRAFKAIKLANGVVGIALAIGTGRGDEGIDGIGGGRLEFAWRANGHWQRIAIDDHTSPYFSVKERIAQDGSSHIEIAYYDDESHGLKFATTPLIGAPASKAD